MVRPRDNPREAFEKWHENRFGILPTYPVTVEAFDALEEQEQELAQERQVNKALELLKATGMSKDDIEKALSQ